MPINPNLLIAAPVLQDYLVDKDNGFPMAAGTVTFYRDDQRNVLKNWYYQSTNVKPYQFSPGPNPMTLTGIGTFADAQGNDIIPYFYPYDESNPSSPQPYYVVVKNFNGEVQFTRENFPFVPSSGSGNQVPTNENYLINNEFWRNFGSANLTTPSNTTVINSTNYLYQTLAPSSHDGFSMPDMVILKDIAGATDTLTFQEFPSNVALQNDITPEYYLEWNCTATQAGQTLKCIQFPLQLHINALQDVKSCTIVFHAKNNGTAALNDLSVQILQFCGSGSNTSVFGPPIQTFTISDSWTKYQTAPFALPSSEGVTIGTTGDDALYVQFLFPVSQTFDIFFAKPQLYLSDTVPTNQWDNYDQIDAIINSPRTGDVRTSMNSFYYYGWVPLDDGQIGNASSNATTRANIDTWPLFNLLWNSCNNTICPLLNSGGANIPRGADAVTDFNANNRLSLPLSTGRVTSGAAISRFNYSETYTTNFGVNNNLTLTGVTPASGFFTGSMVLVSSTGTLSSPLLANNIYYAIRIDSTHIQLATTYANALNGTAINLLSDGSGTQTAFTFILGSTVGEYAHTQLTSEVGIHNHPPPSTATTFVTSDASGALQIGAGAGVKEYSTTGNNTASPSPFNIVQPTVFMNMFIKL